MKFYATILLILVGTTPWARTTDQRRLNIVPGVDLAPVADTSYEQITRRGAAQGFEVSRLVKTAQVN